MSFDKHMGKERRKEYHGSKAIDKTCRNHGGCPACLSNRTHSDTKRKQAADDKIREEQNGVRTMIIRLGETRWANLFDVRELTISHVKIVGSDEVKFRVHIDSDSESYDTDLVDSKEIAIDIAGKIADQLNSCAEYKIN